MVADDSGLEVEGLNGMPGIHSAVYAGPKASDAENVAKLLKMVQIRSNANRKAQFRCVLVAYDPSGKEHVVEGTVAGQFRPPLEEKAALVTIRFLFPKAKSKHFLNWGSLLKIKSHTGPKLFVNSWR